MSRDRLAEVEWKADCLQSRMDALAKSRADAGESIAQLEASYEAYNARYLAEKDPRMKEVRRKELNKALTKLTNAQQKARGDAEDPCLEGYEQRGTKEKGGSTVPNCVKT